MVWVFLLILKDRKMKKEFAIASIVVLFLALTSMTFAEPYIWRVGGGLTIQAAINASSDGDIVLIPAGLYTGAGNRDIDFNGLAITVTSEVPDDPDVVAATVIDCQGSVGDPHRGFIFNSGEGSDSVLSGITIINGYVNVEGGGIYCSQSSPMIQNCVLRGNVAVEGGGMYSYGRSGAPTLFNCIFRQNLATSSTINEGGGGIRTFQNMTMLINCVFTGNHAVQSGGAMLNKGANDDYATLINCTIVGNSSMRFCGGVYQPNSTIRTTLTNCILWGNTIDGVISEDAQIYFGMPVINNCCIQDWSGYLGGYGNIGDDPLFVDADGADNFAGTGDDDLRLSSGSACIDAGDNGAVTEATDLDGHTRIVNGDRDDTATVDMGAYEFDWKYLGDCAGGCDVDLGEFLMLAENWGGDNAAIDISPYLQPDGVIDSGELMVVAEHWLDGAGI